MRGWSFIGFKTGGLSNYDILKLSNHLGRVMISELVSSPVDHGFNHHQINPGTIRLIFAASPWINMSICGPISVSQN